MKTLWYVLCGAFLFMPTAEAQNIDWREFSHTVGISVEKPGGVTSCSGILISPSVVLTAAHCVDGFISAQVTTSRALKGPSVVFTQVVSGSMHPGYRGNLPGGSVDIGLFFLHDPLVSDFLPSITASVNPALPFERIGFGGRNGSNIRTWMTSFYAGEFGDYLRAKDELGVLGDSGGPVFQRHDNGLKLIGVHTGREISPTGVLSNISYIQPLGAKEMNWIARELSK